MQITDDTHPYFGLRPPELWRHFAALNAMPRPSGHEAAARQYVQQVAEAASATYRIDARGNIVVYVPATEDGGAAPVAIQAHLDMVSQHRPDVQHDWETDPIRPRREGDRIYASGTTLGADNGIGAAAMLALLTTPGLQHGPLELVFTVEEETGLHGAAALEAELVASRTMINLDSEDPDELTVGCAGGATTTLHLPVETAPVPDGCVGREIVVSGLKGGHSGVQIHEPLANAIKLLTETLEFCRQRNIAFFLSSIEGGTAHNAIPRDAIAHVAATPEVAAELFGAVAYMSKQLCRQWLEHEPGLEITVRDVAVPEGVVSPNDPQRVLHLLDALPHGVLAMSEVFPGKVETSSNLAEVHTLNNEIIISISSRSFRASELEKTQQQIRVIGESAGAVVEAQDGYPGWEPNPASPLLQIAKETYQKVYGRSPQVEVVHAGLECGVLASRLPGLDAISFGPLIKGAHSPEEYVEISSVEKTWNLLTALLEEIEPGL